MDGTKSNGCKAALRYDKLLVDGRLYTLQELENFNRKNNTNKQNSPVTMAAHSKNALTGVVEQETTSLADEKQTSFAEALTNSEVRSNIQKTRRLGVTQPTPELVSQEECSPPRISQQTLIVGSGSSAQRGRGGGVRQWLKSGTLTRSKARSKAEARGRAGTY